VVLKRGTPWHRTGVMKAPSTHRAQSPYVTTVNQTAATPERAPADADRRTDPSPTVTGTGAAAVSTPVYVSPVDQWPREFAAFKRSRDGATCLLLSGGNHRAACL
jgi:hypothetical protein